MIRVDLSVTSRSQGGRAVLSVVGEVDVYTAPRLRERIGDLVTGGEHHLVVDLSGVDFLDSTGLGVLVGGLNRVRGHRGSLCLVCPQERILKVFRITGLTGVFPIHPDLHSALAAPIQPAEPMP
jgi:anti-sigma B factor antagonist